MQTKTQIPDHVFRGYDLRGLAGSELTEENVEKLGRGYAAWLLQRRIYDCVVGHDCRLSSPKFSKALIKGLTDSGIAVYDIGMTLSQIVYFAAYYFRTKGYAMITASHNPKEYNGFKFGTGFSETMGTEEIVAFRELVKTLSPPKREGKSPFMKSKVIRKDIFSEYTKDLFRRVDKIRPFKVVVDSCAATTGIFLPKILRKAGCKVIEQNTKPDGNFPVGTPDPTEKEVLKRLAKRVVKEKADLGFSYDCDGDRLGVVDGEGNLIWNDTLVSLFAKDALEFSPGSKIVYNTLCSKQVDEVIRRAGGEPIIWKTGHSFIKAKLKEAGGVFGGELSGHFFFADNFYGHDDGAIASLRLLAYLTRVDKSLKEAVAELPRYISSPEIKLGCPDSVKFRLIDEKIKIEIKNLYPGARYTEIDGVRMDTESEMIVIRASQNGPYITVKFEANVQGMYDKLKKQVNAILRRFPEVDFRQGVNTSSLV